MPSHPETGRKSLNIIELVSPSGASGFYWTVRKSAPFLFGSPGTDFSGPFQDRLEAAAEALCAHPPGLVVLEPVVVCRRDFDERDGGWPIRHVTLKLTVGMYPQEIGEHPAIGFVSETGLGDQLGTVVPSLVSSSDLLETLGCDLVWDSVALNRKEGLPVLELLVDARWRHPVRDKPIELLREMSARIAIPRLGIENRAAQHSFVFRAIHRRPQL